MLIDFVKFIRAASPKRFRTILWTSIGAGALEALVVAAVGMGVGEFARSGEVSTRALLLFILCGVGYYFLFRRSMMLSLEVVNEAMKNRVNQVADRLRNVSYEAFQAIEQSKIYSVLLGNHDMVMEAGRFLSSFISGSCMVLLSFVYATTISFQAALSLFAIFVFMALAFAGMEKSLVKSFKQRADKEDIFFASLKDIVLGFIELKMNRDKSDDLLKNRIYRLGDEYFQAHLETDYFQAKSTAFYMSFAFIPIGATVFFLADSIGLTAGQVGELSTLAMFAVTPVLGLCLFFPTAARAVMLLRQIDDFSEALENMKDHDTAPTEPLYFEKIEVKDLEFVYPAVEGQIPFRVFVDHFELKRGELVILRGANGTGKSTFMRVLAGLLKPTSGSLTLNDIPVTSIGYSSYRSLFSILFTDFYLFDGFYGLHVDSKEQQELFKELGIASKVSVHEGRFSTTDLSSGQRKRLAIAVALLEKRPILLFDEVAADFDHHFRDYFYRVFLPKLKAQGRTLLIISHDDRYFDIADRVISMQEGRFVTEITQKLH